MQKERPILFSTPMVQTLLAGRKTQTRRKTKLDYINSLADKATYGKCLEASEMTYNPAPKPGFAAFFGNKEADKWYAPVYCPYGKPGDILWVREIFRKHYSEFDSYNVTTEYAADGGEMLLQSDGDGFQMFNKNGTEKYISWKPSIHMPKSDARIWLLIESIKVERAQDISEEDAKAEGLAEVTKDDRHFKWGLPDKDGFPGGYADNTGWAWADWKSTAKEAWQTLWESINGKESWEANPWVWCVSFKVLSTTGKPESFNLLP